MIDEILAAGPEKSGEEYDQLLERMNSGFDSPAYAAELVCWLASSDADWVSGKVISAQWDPWKDWRLKSASNVDKDLYVLRRVDGRNYVKVEAE
jgi:3-oxoacyl-[acyl-carrier protein] reductase